jgi:type IV pilus assembly protein PilP
MKNKISYGLFVICCALTLSGCIGEEHGDLREWVDLKKATTKPKIQPINEPSVFSPQAYVESTGMDPFNMMKLKDVLRRESADISSNTSLLLMEQKRTKEDLESHPIDAMAMVGSLMQNGKKTALIRVNQLIYQVNAGNYIGQNYGKILQIDEQSIKLREVVQDAAGDWVERITALDLQEGDK